MITGFGAIRYLCPHPEVMLNTLRTERARKATNATGACAIVLHDGEIAADWRTDPVRSNTEVLAFDVASPGAFGVLILPADQLTPESRNPSDASGRQSRKAFDVR
jgi:hypothetical protein